MRIWVFFTTRRITCPTFPYKDFISICMVFWLLGVLVQNEPVYVDTINGCQFLGAFWLLSHFFDKSCDFSVTCTECHDERQQVRHTRIFHTMWSMLLVATRVYRICIPIDPTNRLYSYGCSVSDHRVWNSLELLPLCWDIYGVRSSELWCNSSKELAYA
jgi:hypothetical protein